VSVRRWLLILLLLCAPLVSSLAHGVHGAGAAAKVVAAETGDAAAAEAASGQAVQTAASAGLDGDPCHAHGVALPPPGAVLPASRGAAPSAAPWRPSDGHPSRPERPNWPAARHGAPRQPA